MIDTSSDTEIVAAISANRGAASVRTDAVRHSRNLMYTIDRVISQLSLVPGDLNLVLCGNGPGSFTGLRIGVVCARTFAQVLGIGAVAISSHELYCVHPHVQPGDRIVVAFDAKKQRVYATVFERTHTAFGYKTLFDTQDCDPSVYAACIDESTWFAGDYYARHYPEKRLLPAPDEESIIAFVRHKAEEIVRSGQSTEYTKLLPHYCRKADAEVARTQRASDGFTQNCP